MFVKEEICDTHTFPKLKYLECITDTTQSTNFESKILSAKEEKDTNFDSKLQSFILPTILDSKFLESDGSLDDKNILNDQIIGKSMINLVKPGTGYLCDIYNIKCESIKWLTGWEISKYIHKKIKDDSSRNFESKLSFESKISGDSAAQGSALQSTRCIEGLTAPAQQFDSKFLSGLYGYFGNINNDFMSGFLQYILSQENKNMIKYQFFIYSNSININIINKLKNDEVNIDYIDTIEIDDLQYNSPDICRVIHNYIKRYALYINFSIIDNNNIDIKNAIHSLLNINKEGFLLVSIPWYLKDFKPDESIFMYVYILSCIFLKVQLTWFTWDNKVWVICHKKKDSFNKKKWVHLLNSNEFNYNKIQEKYFDGYNNVKENICTFYDKIKDKILSEKLNINSNKFTDKENIIQQWIKENETELKTFT